MTESRLMNYFGSTLEYLMEEANMTQLELAEKSCLSHSTINAYIRGRRMPTLKSIINISIALECSYDELIDVYSLIE